MLGSFAPIVDGLDRAPADCNAATFFFKKLHQNSGLQIGMVHGCARFLFWPLLSFCALGHFFFCFGTLSFLGHFHFWDTFTFGILCFPVLGHFSRSFPESNSAPYLSLLSFSDYLGLRLDFFSFYRRLAFFATKQRKYTRTP